MFTASESVMAMTARQCGDCGRQLFEAVLCEVEVLQLFQVLDGIRQVLQAVAGQVQYLQVGKREQ